jgi:hypothetical protein
MFGHIPRRGSPRFYNPILESLEERYLLSFLPTVYYGSTATAVTTGSFSNNGRLDLATTDAKSVNLLPGNGDGTFGAARAYPAGNMPIGLAATDVNGDGNLDLVVTNVTDNTVSVLLGDGSGGFQVPASYSTGASPIAVAAGHFRQANKVDLVTGNYDGQSVSVLLGNGDGTFGPAQEYPIGAPTYSVAVGDFARAGRDDIVTANYDATGGVTVFRNNGDGTFQPGVDYPIGSNAYSVSVAVTDLNGDGVPDLVVANQGNNSISIFLGNGDGSFRPAGTISTEAGIDFLTTADFNGDGHTDLVAAHCQFDLDIKMVSVCLGNGDGTFQTAQTYPLNSHPSFVAVGDFNNDGFPDIATANADNVAVLINAADWPGAPVFARAATFASVAQFSGSDFPTLSAFFETVSDDGHSEKLSTMANKLPLGDQVQALWDAEWLGKRLHHPESEVDPPFIIDYDLRLV